MSVQVLFLAAALAMPAAIGRQATPAPTPSANVPDDRLATAAIRPEVTVEGCVATESEIPGRKVSLGERTRLDRHFLLVRGKVVKGKAPAAPPPADAEAAAFAPFYKISGLTDEQVKIHVGRRVRIEGTFGNLDDAQAAGPSDRSDLVELTVATIRQVPGDCTVPKS